MDNFENQARPVAIEERRLRFRVIITDNPELCFGYSYKSEEEKLMMLEAMEQELYSA